MYKSPYLSFFSISIFLSFFLFPAGFYAQQNQGSFIKLKTGEFVWGSEVQLDQNNSRQVLVDNKPFQISDVLFYKDKKGKLFANINGKKSKHFCPLSHEADSVYFFIAVYASQSARQPGRNEEGPKANLYMSERLQPLILVRTKNLENRLAAYPKADAHIQRAKKCRKVATVSFCISGALLASTIVGALSGANMSENFVTVTGAVGSTGIIVGLIANGQKKKHTRRALKEAYGLEID